MKEVSKLINKRISVRSFNGISIDQKTLEELSNYIAENSVGPFGSRARIVVADIGNIPREEMHSYGTYGVIRHATAYLIGMMEKGTPPEDFGYVFEKVILKATELGLGSCWLGGTFSRSGFARAAGLKNSEVLGIVAPIGYPADRRSIIDGLMRTIARSSGRLPFEDLFFQGEGRTPFDKQTSPILGEILELVRLAPSAVNSQPWRIIRTGDIFHFYCTRKGSPKKNPGIVNTLDLRRNDIGIAMCHFELAVKESEDRSIYPGGWVRDDPHLDVPFEYIAGWKGPATG